MNTKAITDWLNTIGIWGLIGLLGYIASIAHPLITKLIESIKDRKVRDGLQIADKLAYTAITTAAQFTSLSNSERKAKAVSLVVTQLSKRGISLSANEVSGIVEKSYQYAKQNNFIKDQPTKQTSTTDQTANNQAQQVNQQLNPQPVQNEQQQNGNGQSNDDDKAKQLAQQVQNNPKAQELLKGMNGNGNQSN